MRKTVPILMLWLTAVGLWAQPSSDPRSMAMMGIPIEGPIDSLKQALAQAEWTEWGTSDDGEDYHFRGNFYGIRAKLMVSVAPETKLATSAYITIGPYSTQKMLDKNMQYFLYKLQKDHGDFSERDGAWFYIDDFGSVKMSVATSETGAKDINVLFLQTTPYYKDALSRGLRGDIQEVVTENAVSEERFMHFHGNGQKEDLDLTDRQYDRYGYLQRARMKEEDGYSTVEYSYDEQYRLKKRTLTNETAGIRYVNTYQYNEQDEVVAENQKVYDKTDDCIMTINMLNNFLTRDDNGNWTSNSLTLTYWERGNTTQQSTVLQRRTLTYWE